jgi:hypothetical protein
MLAVHRLGEAETLTRGVNRCSVPNFGLDGNNVGNGSTSLGASKKKALDHWKMTPAKLNATIKDSDPNRPVI